MDFFDTLLTKYMDWPLVLIIVLSSYFFKNFFEMLLPKIHMKYKVLVWSTIIAALYYWAMVSVTTDSISIYQLVISYFFATSFYELLLQPILKFADKNKNKD